MFRSIFTFLLSIFTTVNTFTKTASVTAIDSLVNPPVVTDVLEDLHKDPKFKEEDYPATTSKDKIEVIQIALSSNDELYIYTYQPRNAQINFVCSSISFADNADGTNTKIYKLKELNENGVFNKYVVDNYRVPVGDVKRISIVGILRLYTLDYDAPLPEGAGTIDEVPYEVAQKWYIHKENDTWKYIVEGLEVINITDKHVGRLSYPNGLPGISSSTNTDSHYVAFSTDKDIQRLIDATIVYDSRDVTDITTTTEHRVSYKNEKQNVQVKLSEKETATNTPNGLFGFNYSWKRIQSVQDFIKAENLKQETIDQIKNMKWVLRFHETTYKHIMSTVSSSHMYTEVSKVSILRLHFVTNGITYDLGVVDGKQTADPETDNIVDTPESLMKDWWTKFQEDLMGTFNSFAKIIQIVLIILGVVLLAKPIGWIFKGIKHLVNSFIDMFK